MQTNKMLLTGIVGTVAFFLLGFLLYGMLMMDFMTANCGSATGINKEPEMWALVVSNLGLGFLFTYILGSGGKTPSVGEGLKTGALVGCLMAISFDFTMYATTNMMNLTGTVVDVAVFTVMCSLGSAVVAFMLGRGAKAA